ncbi:hypothetical protein Poly59_23890 [Rubripirellula reticaptiva]|uniref:Uncharacterized protein n=1 Tax=Rubripirellula reticaptiva TaxID=2528013 RepID=A0A5C6F4G0_9BACT|nr:hypothetical protein Poly59_23890 [Rubripirellula reticaptiva]
MTSNRPKIEIDFACHTGHRNGVALMSWRNYLLLPLLNRQAKLQFT